MRIKCKICGQIHNPKDDCKKIVKSQARNAPTSRKPFDTARERRREEMPAAVSVPAKGHAPLGPGQQIQIRLQADLLQRLDQARGGMTRPAKIREILEKNL